MAKKLTFFLFFVLLATYAPLISRAQSDSGAGFVFTPTSGAYMSGSTILVTVSIDTKGNAINAADATISFPTKLLKVTSVSKANSIFKFWVQDPTYSNIDGTIIFSGGLPTPGFTGSSGTAFSITFQALGSGIAKLKVTDGAILANNGFGTNIISFNQEPTYQISVASRSADLPTPKGEIPAQAFGVPDAPLFFSRTYSNERAWYASKSFEMSWNLASDVDGVAYALVRDSNYYLSPMSKGLIDSVAYDLSKYKDGIWYFYVRLHNKNGWGPSASRAVLMDFSEPKPFAVVRVDKDDPTNPSPALSFNTTDTTSPISGYTISIDSGAIIDAGPLKRGNVYIVPALLPGSHLILVRAYDSARNYTDGLLQVDIKPLQAPEITSYSYNVSPPQKP
ncbi:MAG: cohesin domain-containing protein, partial [Patescibacteria group bacterium]